jgi:phosphoribosylaminoimidazolecarboxamide formyltransferase/IMP cyclohydrolase
MLDGRVKTLHPKVHGGLLARRDVPEHMAALEAHGIDTIDLLVVNLYPFEATVAKAGCTLADAIENIDIGGPAMVRSAAKNWKDVGVLTDADQYPAVLEELKANGKLSDKLRFALSVAAFNRIAQYDGAISDYLSSVTFRREQAVRGYVPARTLFPGQSNGSSSRCRTCATARTATSRPRCTATSTPRPARWSPACSCRARNCPTTTSPTPMPRGNASRASTRRPA